MCESNYTCIKIYCCDVTQNDVTHSQFSNKNLQWRPSERVFLKICSLATWVAVLLLVTDLQVKFSSWIDQKSLQLWHFPVGTLFQQTMVYPIIWTFYIQAGNKFLKSRFVSVKFDYPNPNLGFNRIFRLRLLKIRFGFEIFMKMKVNREYSWIRKFPNGTSKWIYCDTNFVTCVTLLGVTWKNFQFETLTASIYFFN